MFPKNRHPINSRQSYTSLLSSQTSIFRGEHFFPREQNFSPEYVKRYLKESFIPRTRRRKKKGKSAVKK